MNAATFNPASRVVVVAIGRNEGERLRMCLESCARQCDALVYVDSGSTDDSVALARGLGAQVVELDIDVPFTAARARNTGLAHARASMPNLEFVQFIDGDCVLDEGWLSLALERMEQDPTLAVVCGRRRERFPDRTVYNRLCDIEWNTPVGPALASGGDALMRTEALAAVEGFRDAQIAGEEPELCYRLRAEGWRIERLDAEMTIHDANMTRFSQWWKRTERGGHAFAENAVLHGADPERFCVKETASSVVWASLIGMSAVVPPLAPVVSVAALSSLARTYQGMRGRGFERADSALYAASCLASKVPQAIGAGRLAARRLARRESTLLEYK